jgi:hypothetical protein
MNRQNEKIRIGWIAALLLIAISWRVFTAGSESLANTSPLMAMCFGGGLLLGFRFCWVPVVLLIVSDLFLGLTTGTGVGSYSIFTSLAFTAAAVAGAFFHRHRAEWMALFFGTLTCSLVFYFAANTFVWAASPGYAKTLAGWWQSQTIGLPGPWPPSWMFLRNALFGDIAWCLIAAPLFFWEPARLPLRNSADAATA